jgi:hypothetical protein
MANAGRIVLILMLLLSAFACGERPEANGDFPRIEFTVDTDSLSSEILVDGLFSMRMPHDWPEIDGESLAAAKNVLKSDSTSYFGLELLRIAESVKGASCAVSRVAGSAFSFDLLSEEYERSLIERFQTNDVKRGAFCFNGNNFIQYRVVTARIVAFKLFCNFGGSFYQIDYFIPKEIYEAEIHKVESSIGSITSLLKGKGVMKNGNN